jgi:CRISPR/Cas system-associated protein Cas7 (RAMP superfamily)
VGPIRSADEGRVIRLPANRYLQVRIKDCDAIGQRVRSPTGQMLLPAGGHYQKIYEVELVAAPLPAEPKPEPEKPKRIETRSKEDRREALKTLIGLMKGRPVGAKTANLLREFAGEAWADKAITRAEAAK